MPLATIWRDAHSVTDKQVIAIRDIVQFAVQTALGVELDEVEVRVRDVGPLDINYKPIGIEVDTGTGKGGQRVARRKELACEIARRVLGANVLEPDWIGPEGSYVWMRICESSFVPIGHPEHAR